MIVAHYAKAVPFDHLKTEQDRIGALLDILDAATAGYAEVQAELVDCLDLASDCHTVYRKALDPIRRPFNQAFLRQELITDTGQVHTQPTGAFTLLLDPTDRKVAASLASIVAIPRISKQVQCRLK